MIYFETLPSRPKLVMNHWNTIHIFRDLPSQGKRICWPHMITEQVPVLLLNQLLTIQKPFISDMWIWMISWYPWKSSKESKLGMNHWKTFYTLTGYLEPMLSYNSVIVQVEPIKIFLKGFGMVSGLVGRASTSAASVRAWGWLVPKVRPTFRAKFAHNLKKKAGA